eukprot:SAG31_NODE_7535_length_1662_cov_1.112604_2_plen_122_part_00
MVVAYPVWKLSGADPPVFKFLPKIGGAESLAYGALMSAVDPVATLAVFGALGVETDLNMRVFGESILNGEQHLAIDSIFPCPALDTGKYYNDSMSNGEQHLAIESTLHFQPDCTVLRSPGT